MSTDPSPEQIVLRAIRETLLEEGRAELPGWGILSVEHRSGRVRATEEDGKDEWTVEPPEEVIAFAAAPSSRPEPDPATES